MSALALRHAVRALRAGGVVAYPTEAVWGLGCEPRDREAVAWLLQLKQRDWRRGLILIAADLGQLRPFVGDLESRHLQPALSSWPGPATWLLPASSQAPRWITGGRETIAVRVTAHPPAVALCRAYGGAIVSTSANIAGRPPALTRLQLRSRFGSELDVILPGALGKLDRPTPIRDLVTGKIVRE